VRFDKVAPIRLEVVDAQFGMSTINLPVIPCAGSATEFRVTLPSQACSSTW
jgi:hypothetical protein